MPGRSIALLACSLLSAAVQAQTACPPGQPRLIVYHAGSVSAAFKAVESLFTQRTGVCVDDRAGGSVASARQITAGMQPCDIFASADDAVIERMLKPAGYADYSIRFAEGAMVLAYTTASRGAAQIAPAADAFRPPESVPTAAADWAVQLTQPGVVIGGSHPFLDPGGYRADLIFQLARDRSARPDLYGELLAHYTINKTGDALGKTYDYQFTYEHSAQAAYRADSTGSYRYAKLPDDAGLGSAAAGARYARFGITIPGLQSAGAAATVTIPARRVTWGLTVLKDAPNPAQALAFLQLLFSPQGVALQAANGPAPISPPLVSRDDFVRLPAALKTVVRTATSSTD